MTVHPHEIAERVGDAPQARDIADMIDQNVPDTLRSGQVADVLRGKPLGHALHPMMTDFPLGMWSAAIVLDLVGRGRWAPAAQTLTIAGLAGAVPTVASGLAEWDRIPQDDRGTAAVHAVSNSVAATCFAASAIARGRRRHALAATASLLGGVAALAGGYLGGHLSFGRSVGPGPRVPRGVSADTGDVEADDHDTTATASEDSADD